MTPQTDLITIPTIEDLTRRQLFSSALAAALLVACSDDDDAPGDGGMVTIDDYFGPVTIPANPRRVIAGDAQTMAAMLNLGVSPVGSYFVGYTGFPAYLGISTDQVQDVTLTGASEIDLEKALALDPDLLITIVGTNGDTFLQERYERYRQLLPTFGWMRDYRSLAGHEEGFVDVGRQKLLNSPLWPLLDVVKNDRVVITPNVLGTGSVYTRMECLRLWDQVYSKLA